MAFGFGRLTDDDLARALARNAAGAPIAFAGAPSIDLPSEATGQPIPPVGSRPFGFDRLPALPAVDAAPAGAGAAPQSAHPLAPPRLAGARQPGLVPLPPPRPGEFASSADLPAPDAVPIQAQRAPNGLPNAVPAASDEPSMLDQLMSGIRKSDGLLTSLGIGLMTQRGLGPAVAAGLQHHQGAEKARAATDLAKAELGLKQRKLAQETAAMGGNVALLKRAYPDLSDTEAMSAAGNGSLVTEALKRLSNPNSGRDIQSDATGIKRFVDTGQPIFSGETARPDYVQATAPDGSVLVYDKGNPNTRQTIAAAQPARPVTSEEREQFGLGPSVPAKMTAKDGPVAIGTGGTSVNVGTPEKEQDKVVGKGFGEYQLDLANKGRNAASTKNTLALMEQAMNAPGFYSGVGGEAVKRANQFLGALGVQNPNAASGAEVFGALSNKVVLDGLGGSLGPGISNTDRDYISRTAPTLEQSEHGNRALIGIARALADRQLEVARLARDYAGRNGGRLDGAFDQVVEDYAAKNPLFPQARDGATASAPKEPPQGAPAGARQARDGNWYVPDPNRSGKFLRLQVQ